MDSFLLWIEGVRDKRGIEFLFKICDGGEGWGAGRYWSLQRGKAENGGG